MKYVNVINHENRKSLFDEAYEEAPVGFEPTNKGFADLPLKPLGYSAKKTKSTLSGFRAGNGTRTRDINLGKVALYQLSYSRMQKILKTLS